MYVPDNRMIMAQIIKNTSYVNKLKSTNDELLTFFTPTYNRARFLTRIEKCLKLQTNSNFVWVIVNDGSKDNTDEVVSAIMRKEQLPIKYISKPNGGKHSAFKAALEQCETTYFQCMDDDDIYFADAVDFYLRKWAEIKADGNNEIGAIRTLSRRPDGRFVTNFKVVEGEEYDASTIATNYVMKRHQENWTCYDTEKLRSIDLFKPYWMSESHRFVTESIWQTRFARKYKCRYVNRAFREYRDDADVSLTRGVKSRQHYLDLFLNTKISLDEQYDLMWKYHKTALFKSIAMVNCLRGYLSISFKQILKNTPPATCTVLPNMDAVAFRKEVIRGGYNASKVNI